jgi:hypothetical protein
MPRVRALGVFFGSCPSAPASASGSTAGGAVRPQKVRFVLWLELPLGVRARPSNGPLRRPHHAVLLGR